MTKRQRHHSRIGGTEEPIEKLSPFDEAKQLLKDAARTIRYQRQELDILRAKLDMFEKIFITLQLHPNMGGHGITTSNQIDPEWPIDTFLRKDK